MSELDKEFESVVQEINDNLNQAAELIKKANNLANKAGLKGLILTDYTSEHLYKSLGKDEEKYEEIRNKYDQLDVGELESALDHAGWSTSSSYC